MGLTNSTSVLRLGGAPSKRIPELTEEVIARFWSRVDKTPGHGPKGDCWIWTAGKFPGGYGCFPIDNESFLAHRVAWLITTGEDPFPLHVLHECDFRPCVRHLFKGTTQDNLADMRRKGREARGDRNGSRTHPERLTRGSAHWTVKFPEFVLRGQSHGRAKLTLAQVEEIRSRAASGETGAALALEFGIDKSTACAIIRHRIWKP